MNSRIWVANRMFYLIGSEPRTIPLKFKAIIALSA
jgi:hypothetical protein